MPSSWKPSAGWTRKFREALDAAFDDGAMELLTADFFPPRRRFSKIAPQGLGTTFELRLHALIEAARMDDWLLDLVAAAHDRRPRNAELAELAQDLGLTAAGPRLDNPTGQPLEQLIQANAKFINLALFLARVPALQRQVCWVDVPGGGGTGFLVGPDLVLTNDHVVERVRGGAARWQDVRCRFDYRQALDGTPVDQRKQTIVALDAAKPLVHRAPPSASDWDPALGDARAEEADCALLRLAEDVGEAPVGGGVGDPAAEKRGWIDATANAPPVAAGSQVFLLQHPEGEPQQLSIGTVKAFNARGTRLRYDANSKDGSSGSPCFNADLQLVALHHAFDPDHPPKWNQAIPLDCVRRSLQAAGVVLTAP